MNSRIPIVAIVGRTNVGKSTLFNAIIGRRVAVVEDYPGVTRDRNYAYIKRFDFPFTLIDTGGLLGEETGKLQAMVKEQAELAIKEADVILAVFDAMEGPHPHDYSVVDLLRKSKKQVLWVINKCEKERSQAASNEFYALGIDHLVLVSAEHRIGIPELIDKVKEGLSATQLEPVAEVREDQINVAIIGRPNVGKSTLINKILGQDRLVTSDIPGTTTDSIDTVLKRDGKVYRIVDTAGLRKKDKVNEGSVERYSNLRTLKCLVASDVAILMLDATAGLPGEQDKNLAALVDERGRGLVIVVNKWDLVEKDHKTVKDFEDAIRHELPFASYAPIIFVSALSGKRCPKVLETVREVYEQARKKIPTSELNKILKAAFERRSPPVYRGAPVSLVFAVQVEVAPPTIVLFLNQPRRINAAYQRYLKNTLREHFPFPGCSIRFVMRKRGEGQVVNRQKDANDQEIPVDNTALELATDHEFNPSSDALDQELSTQPDAKIDFAGNE